MKVTFEFDLEKREDRQEYSRLMSQNASIYSSQLPPASLQIHTPTTDKINDRAEKGITVYTTEGNETVALDSLSEVIAEGEHVEEVVVDEKPEIKETVKMVELEPTDVEKVEEAVEKKKVEESKPKKATKKATAKKPDKSESGKQIRKLMLEACKLPDINIAAVNEAIFTACDVTALKDIKPDQADKAMAAIKALIDSKGYKA
jgi:hypothetical protein